MNCPFCGTNLAKVAAICPSCKIQLPEIQYFSYYMAALERDRSLAKPEMRAKLDALVKEEAEARRKLLAEARERARIEEEAAAAQRAKEAEEYRARQAIVAQEMKQKREEFLSRNRKKIRLLGVFTSIAAILLVGASIIFKPDPPKPYESNDVRLDPCTALGIATRDSEKLLLITTDSSLSGGISRTEFAQIDIEAESIQAALFEKTIGQANERPKLESMVIDLHTALGNFRGTIGSLMAGKGVVNSAITPLKKVILKSQQVCNSEGLGKEFNEAKNGY